MDSNDFAFGAPDAPTSEQESERAILRAAIDDMTAAKAKLRELEGREPEVWQYATGAVALAMHKALLVGREIDATQDQIIELAEALEMRRILEEIKMVAAIHPPAYMPTPFQAAWQGCCEEIFYRATGKQWHMDEDAARFALRASGT